MGADMDAARPYEVLLTPEAEEAYLAVRSKADLTRLDSMLDVLDTVPDIGRAYDPLYEAARPSIEGLRVVYAGHFGIYYVIDEDAGRVVVVAIEDQRRDPLTRFSHLDSQR